MNSCERPFTMGRGFPFGLTSILVTWPTFVSSLKRDVAISLCPSEYFNLVAPFFPSVEIHRHNC